jgi:hypothetical protein
MSNYRCVYVPGGSYFFTVVTERRVQLHSTICGETGTLVLDVTNISLLPRTIPKREMKQRTSFLTVRLVLPRVSVQQNDFSFK